MPYCTTEAFISGLGPALASFLLHDDSQEMDETEVGQLLMWRRGDVSWPARQKHARNSGQTGES